MRSTSALSEITSALAGVPGDATSPPFSRRATEDLTTMQRTL
jgi:hypothetical protein